MYNKIKKWAKERDALAIANDLEGFRKFYKKYQKLGIYDKDVELPEDKILEVSLHKMVCESKRATDQEKADAAGWLVERGYTPGIYFQTASGTKKWNS